MDDQSTPSLATDQHDYAPGSTSYIAVGNLPAGTTAKLRIVHVIGAGPDGLWGTLDDDLGDNSGSGHTPWYVTDGGEGDLDGIANGTIQTSWYVNPDDSLNQAFLLTASLAGEDRSFGTPDDTVATTTFTDWSVPTLDLTAGGGTAGWIDGVWFVAGAAPTSTGASDIFLQLTAGGVEFGYNTDKRPPEFDENPDPTLTHSLQLSAVPQVMFNGELHREFVLEIDESDGLLSLDSLQIYLGTSGGLTLADLPFAFRVFDIDLTGDKWVALSDSVPTSPGSGMPVDLTVYVPDNMFSLAPPGYDYVYVFSAFGLAGVEAGSPYNPQFQSD